MTRANVFRIFLATLTAACLSACATTPPASSPSVAEPIPGPASAALAPAPLPAAPPARGFPLEPSLPPGLLSAPPAGAQAGECFAKVTVRGALMAPPPVPPHAVWVMTPPRPGDIGPTYCLYFQPGAPPPPVFGPDRTGWIRVVCDRDLTRDRVRDLQRRLGDLGLYHGAAQGRYDQETARAVARFQERRAIPHGGYLSLETMKALEGRQPPLPAPPQPPAAYPPPPGLIAQGLRPPGLAPGAVVLPAPCGAAPCATSPRDAGAPPYKGYLNWPGKSLY